MDKKSFNSLDIKEQIEYINSQLVSKRGATVTSICEEIGVRKATIVRKFKNANYWYDRSMRMYILQGNSNIMEVQDNYNTTEMRDDTDTIENQDNSNIIENQDNYNTNISELYDKDIKELISMKDDLKEIIKQFKNIKIEEAAVGLASNEFDIDIDKFSGVIKTRTIMLHENVLEDYLEFCNQHKEFKKQDILSQALYEFLQKYK